MRVFSLPSVFLVAFFLLQAISSQAQLTFWNTLEAYYPLDGDGLDLSGNQLHANAINTVPDTGITGAPNSCLRFDGVDSRVIRSFLDLGDSSTFSAWFCAQQDSQACPLIYNGNTQFNGYGFFVKKPFGGASNGPFGRTLVIVQGGVSENYFNNQFELPTGEWLHLALVRKGNVLELYLNGVFQSSGPYSANTPAGEFGIGNTTAHMNSGFPAFRGKVDEVMIFSSGLPSDDVYRVYQANLTHRQELLAAGGQHMLRLAPNPSAGREVRLYAGASAYDRIQVVDIRGKAWVDRKGQGASESKVVRLDLSELPSGIYMVLADKGGKTISEKLILR